MVTTSSPNRRTPRPTHLLPRYARHSLTPLQLWVGFDTEHFRDDDDAPEGAAPSNTVLSYQIYSINPETEHGVGRVILANGRRLSLSQVIAAAVEASLTAGVVSVWPGTVALVAHFSLADLCSLRDFDQLKFKFDAIRRTLVTLNSGRRLVVHDSSRNRHEIRLVLRDTTCLAPDGSRSLKALGEAIGIEKLDVGDDIRRMDALLKRDPALFNAYALRDAEIAVKYALRVLQLCKDLGLPELPPTLSAVGVKLLEASWDRDGLDRRRVLGLELVREPRWDRRSRREVLVAREVPVQERAGIEQLAVESYHGARNEAFLFGAGRPGHWSDWDLAGAYSTALALVGLPDWERWRRTRDLADFKVDELGYARVRFAFPPGTRFPCLPVRTEHGLVFPLEGETYCCSPEIDLSIRMGAKIEVLDGVVVPSDRTVRPFLPFVRECAARRQTEPKGSLEEGFWKEAGNSVYGKVAQGLARKRVFDSRTGRDRDPWPSKVSCAPIAAWTTSYVRAVLGEILSRLPADVTVLSATTDGFISDADDEAVDAAAAGPLCRMFASGHEAVAGNARVLVRKHEVAVPLCWRTRGQATVEVLSGVDPDRAVLLARAGLRPPDGCNDENEWIVEQFLKRTYNTHIVVPAPRTLREIFEEGGDFVVEDRRVRLSMEFDFKRRPAARGERDIRDVPRVWFDTTPWRNIGEFRACREAFEAWRKNTGSCLKRLSDLEAFEVFWRAATWGATSIANPGAMLRRVIRAALRAYVRGLWGFVDKGISRRELARRFREAGYQVRLSDFENARRPTSIPLEQAVVPLPAVVAFVAAAKEILGPFDEAWLYRPYTSTSQVVPRINSGTP